MSWGKADSDLGKSLRMSDGLAGGRASGGGERGCRRYYRSIASSPCILSSLSVSTRSGREARPFTPKDFWAWRQENGPTDRAPQFERIHFLPDRFGNLGYTPPWEKPPAFPPDPIPGGLGDFFRQS
ncbi:hypothetical protein MPNT_280025 [Candidatus Methylacidithermus pantelleriae]|uniref:Uncharacterized protein n=1 Tax=Candidatus Methylacidithermus pantelleriae TaxID=2744239 RepID=A0A8J2FST3_9BACT|nr:hypothetical protein MPNT_280025 [Candidatus Methylacidithermus pantelleriae]